MTLRSANRWCLCQSKLPLAFLHESSLDCRGICHRGAFYEPQNSFGHHEREARTHGLVHSFIPILFSTAKLFDWVRIGNLVFIPSITCVSLPSLFFLLVDIPQDLDYRPRLGWSTISLEFRSRSCNAHCWSCGSCRMVYH